MRHSRLYICSPDGRGVDVLARKGISSMPSHGMYRIEADVREMAARSMLGGLIAHCLEELGHGESIFLILSASKSIEPSDNLELIRRGSASTVYQVKGGMSSGDLEVIASLPYGEVSLIGVMAAAEDSALALDPIDLEDAMAVLGGAAAWAIGYYETGVLTLLTRSEASARKLVRNFAEQSVFSCLEQG